VTRRVRVRLEAELDVETAARWYETQRAGLGIDYIDEISRTLSSLAYNALRNPEIIDGVRRVLTRRFPYSITYRIVGDEVVVLSVLHMSREPPVRTR